MRAPVEVPRARDYLTIVAKGWVVILLATLLSPAVAFGVQKLTHERSYEASVLLFAQVAGDPGTYSAYAGGIGANSRMATYVELAQSSVISERTIEELDLPLTPSELSADVTAAWEPYGLSRFARPSSALLRVRVTGTDPQTTIDTVNTLASFLMKMSGELEYVEAVPTDPIQYTGPAAELVAVDPATVAHEVQPDVKTPLLVAAGVGFALSLVLVLAFGLTRDNVLTGGQLAQVANSLTPSSGDAR
ncbi:MAG: YveK family protein [Mycobacterium sp.]